MVYPWGLSVGLGRSSEIPWGSLGVFWESLRVLGGPLASLWGSLGVLGGSSGGPRGSLGRGQKEPKTQKVLSERLGGVLGGPWGDFDRLGWSLDPAHGVANVNISLVLVMFLQSMCFRCLFCDFSV